MKGNILTNPSRSPEIQCVIFDLGGVLIELDGPPVSPENNKLEGDAIWNQWLHSPAVREYESGRCDREAFAEQIIVEMQLQDSAEAFLHYFEHWPTGFYPESQQILEKLSSQVKLACLSNTNELHWQRFSKQSSIFNLFDMTFMSFEVGLMKPDLAIFDSASRRIELPHDTLLFLDDNQMNVDAARASGWHAEKTRGPAEVISCLKQYGLL